MLGFPCFRSFKIILFGEVIDDLTQYSQALVNGSGLLQALALGAGVLGPLAAGQVHDVEPGGLNEGLACLEALCHLYDGGKDAMGPAALSVHVGATDVSVARASVD